MQRPTLDFFLEFASTYSYPATMRISALADAAGVTVRWRPILLGPIFQAQGMRDSPFNLYPTKGLYMMRDLARICAVLGLPFRRPDPFPQPSLLAARVAYVGFADGWGEEFCRAVYRAEFGDGRQIGEEAVIADLLKAVGVPASPVFARARSDEIKAKLRAETAEAERRGVFGAPTFITADGELFWGNDRLEQAIAWAKKAMRVE